MPASDLTAIVCDIDGCLAPETSEPLALERLAQLAAHNRRAAAQRDRPMLTLCSGRPAPFVEAMARLLGVRDLPAVAENGVWLWFPADGRYELDGRITVDQCRQVGEASLWAAQQLEPLGFMQQPGKRCSMSLYHADEQQLVRAAAELPAVFERQGWPLRVSRTWHWINCDLAQVSKATGIERLRQHADVPRHRLAGIGDTLGDLGIRHQVGWFACPANAVAELKQHADYVSPAAELDGVLDILRHLALHHGWSGDA